MADFPTKSALRALGETALLTRNSQITRAACNARGTDTDAFLEALAAVADAVIGQLIGVQSGVFIDAAKGDALKRRIYDLVGLLPKDAVGALGSVDFQVATAMLSDLAIPAGTKLTSQLGLEFETTVDVVYPKATTNPLTVPVRSLLAGSTIYAPANTINGISSTITSAPDGLTVNNPRATSVGDDDESDDSYRAGYREFFNTVRRGTLSAIEARARRFPGEGVATKAGGVTTAKAFEILDGIGRQQKQVLLGITDRFTEQYVVANTDPPLYQVESQVLAQAVFNSLVDTRGAGIYVHVYVAATVVQTIQMALSFQATANINDTATRARAAVVNYVNLLAPGQPLLRSALVQVLRGVPGLVVTGNEIVYPPGDVIARALQAIRTSLTYVTASASQSDRPLASIYSPDAFTVTTG
jgi:uncharacterized phage protein gp47/JayE